MYDLISFSRVYEQELYDIVERIVYAQSWEKFGLNSISLERSNTLPKRIRSYFTLLFDSISWGTITESNESKLVSDESRNATDNQYVYPVQGTIASGPTREKPISSQEKESLAVLAKTNCEVKDQSTIAVVKKNHLYIVRMIYFIHKTDMTKLQFTVLKERWNARVWELKLNGTTIQTPIFMPVGTKATIKGLFLEMLQNPYWIGEHHDIIKLILANTFHLYLRPGDSIVQQAGWLHTFENRPWLILTDSWWFQVFSLGLAKKNDEMIFSHAISMKLKEEWVLFRSPYDGSKHIFTPENVVDIQRNLGSDIMMMLDVCSPGDADKKTIESHMHMTHRRAKRWHDHFMKEYESSRWVLFPIIQGWSHLDLREQSIQALTPLAVDGIAVWWVSVGESKEKVQEIVSFTWPKLPKDKPRYLMGVWTPEDISHAIEQWFDMFDCVLATRLGRHGVMFSDEGNIHISNARYRNDFSPFSTLSDGLKKYSKAYIYHLIKEKEMLWGILLSLHNILYLHHMLEKRKQEMLAN